MARLEELTRGAPIRGILPDALVTILAAKWLGDNVIEITFKRRRRTAWQPTRLPPGRTEAGMAGLGGRTAHRAPFFIQDSRRSCSPDVFPQSCRPEPSKMRPKS
jgi:hypothetical protein